MRYLLHDVFTDSVNRFPSRAAIVTEAGKKITYKDLNGLSNRFANLFQSLKTDIKKYPYVGLISPVHISSITAIIGALKIGCAYIPLDEYSPTERLGYIINNTNLETIAVDSNWYSKHKNLFNKPQIKNIILLNNGEVISKTKKIHLFKDVLKASNHEPPTINQVSDDLAYILHSSGSTGIPKGIMLTHRNARTFVDWMQKEFKLTQKDKVMSRAPFKFDLSVFDIFNTFKVGATLICYDWNKKRENDKKHSDYVKLIEKEKATFLYTTPSTFISLLNRGGLGIKKNCLKNIMYAGEPFAVPQLRKLQQALPKTKIANIYGPTETNIITYYWINRIPENDNASIPLGGVVDDTEIIVVSEDQKKICAPNELGELWCRGGTVTIGYLGMEEKTKEHLVLSPFHKYPVHFWRTGDYGYKDKEGCLHYRGRKDHMVKVKGFRIEIGEIETAISSYPNLDEFVVIAKPDEKYGNRLYCYYSVLNNKKITENDLRTHLLTKIPEYMIPYRFFQMKTLPKTSSGKVDRVLLANETTNKINIPIIGPNIYPDRKILYCLDSDESHVTSFQRKLTKYELKQDKMYARDNSSFGLSMQLCTNPDDGIILDEKYLELQKELKWLYSCWDKLNIKYTKNVYYSSPKNFINTTKTILDKDNYDAISTISYSFLLNNYSNLKDEILASSYVNSKTSLVGLAHKFNFKIPKTKVIKIKDLPRIANKIKKGNFLFIKTDGLGGGVNVHKMQNLKDASRLCKIYGYDTDCIVQEPVDKSYAEVIVAATVTQKEVKNLNTRFKLVSDNSWFGNVFMKDFKLGQVQQRMILNACEALRQNHYLGLVGFDAFISKKELLLTDINARYLGSTPAERILVKLNLLNKVNAVYVNTNILVKNFDKYKKFVETHIYNKKNRNFSIIPVSFCAYVKNNSYKAGLLILGNFKAFSEEAIKAFSKKSFANIKQTTEIHDKLINRYKLLKN